MCGVWVSCEKSSENLLIPIEGKSFNEEVRINDIFEIRSRSIQAFPADPEEALQGENFFFKFTSSESSYSQLNMEVKFTAPSGQIVYVAMNNQGVQYDGSVLFTLNRILSQYGKYDFEYGFRYNGSFTKMPNTSSYSLWVLHQNIPLGNDYDSSNDSGYANNYCTAWVAWKVNQMWGTSNEFPSGLGWARDWRSNLSSYGYVVDNTPRVGAIAWWNKLGDCMYQGRPCGHVAFVSKIENGEVYISEYNGRNPTAYGDLKLSDRDTYPTSFIHVQTKKQ